jgi:hypothetical protein
MAEHFKLHQMSGAAVSTLGKVMVDPTTPPSTKVRAAEAIISHGARAIELEDIEARLSELERAAEPRFKCEKENAEWSLVI